ncbi:MAG: ANTAR domain-containing protein [Clostridiales bacterium]|nr:ANTAR domain-containing protein [Clostridiales bacterium]
MTVVSSCADARKKAVGEYYDVTIVNSPLRDESGESMCAAFAKDMSQVIIIVKRDIYDEVSSHMERVGVITVPKPIDRQLFRAAVKMAKAADTKVRRLKSENTKLMQRIEDMRVINRAKLLLVTTLAMSESEAHKYIEKQAMDTRKQRRDIAEGILRTYEIR